MNKDSLPTMGNHEILSLFAELIEELGRRGLTGRKIGCHPLKGTLQEKKVFLP